MNDANKGQISVEFWGPFACFSPSYAKVDRYSLSVPTPSAVRGMLDAVYCKPVEFYWQVNKIEVLNPISVRSDKDVLVPRMNFKRNEVKSKMGNSLRPIDVDVDRTQRNTFVLSDVRYRVTATIVPRPGHKLCELYPQAVRRFERGQCFHQPYFGCREFVANFALSDGNAKPIAITKDFGVMLYDMFDVRVCDTSGYAPKVMTLYHCQMNNGVIEVPDVNSNDVWRVSDSMRAALVQSGGVVSC